MHEIILPLNNQKKLIIFHSCLLNSFKGSFLSGDCVVAVYVIYINKSLVFAFIISSECNTNDLKAEHRGWNKITTICFKSDT